MKILNSMLFASLFLFCAVTAHAYTNRTNAVVGIMNKAAGKTQTMTIPVGTTADFEKLSITVRACKQTDPFDAEDFFMFVEVATRNDGKIFSNWMSRNNPGDRPLQHADYDVWLVRCE